MAKKPYKGDPSDTIRDHVLEEVSAFFERQKGGHVEWTSDRYHRRVFGEMVMVHQWWRVDRPALEKEMAFPRMNIGLRFKGGKLVASNSPRHVRNRKRFDEIEREIATTDTKMLLKVVRILPYLWD